jgi:hypothetical protein
VRQKRLESVAGFKLSAARMYSPNENALLQRTLMIRGPSCSFEEQLSLLGTRLTENSKDRQASAIFEPFLKEGAPRLSQHGFNRMGGTQTRRASLVEAASQIASGASHIAGFVLKRSSIETRAADHEAKDKAARVFLDDDFTRVGSFGGSFNDLDLPTDGMDLQPEHIVTNALALSDTRGNIGVV